jgi:hypothetical protein
MKAKFTDEDYIKASKRGLRNSGRQWDGMLCKAHKSAKQYNRAKMKQALFILSIILTQSCATYNRCAEKYGGQTQRDTIVETHERLVPVEVKMPADTIETIIDCSHIYRHVKIEQSKRGLLESDVTAQNAIVTVRTRIVPQYLRDTVTLVDTTFVYQEKVTLAKPRSNFLWIMAAMVAILAMIATWIVARKVYAQRQYP